MEAVWHEIGASSGRVPNLAKLEREAWFGTPIRVEIESEIERVESLRIGVFGASRLDPPTLHLGESQTVHVISTVPEYSGSIWITEDLEAFRYAESRGIITHDCLDVLRELVAFGEMTRTQAYELAEEMLSYGRPLRRAPRSPQDF